MATAATDRRFYAGAISVDHFPKQNSKLCDLTPASIHRVCVPSCICLRFIRRRETTERFSTAICTKTKERVSLALLHTENWIAIVGAATRRSSNRYLLLAPCPFSSEPSTTFYDRPSNKGNRTIEERERERDPWQTLALKSNFFQWNPVVEI